MANKKLWVWFFGFMFVYFLARYARSNFEGIPTFFKYHFTDLLFIPTVATFSLIFVRKIKRDDSITISLWLIGLLVLLMSLYFEWYLPTYKSHLHPYTSDSVDVAMYVLGGSLFLIIQKKAFQSNGLIS